MKFNIIVDIIHHNEQTNKAVFNSFYLQEETTGNCFKSDFNNGNGYLVAHVTKDEYNNYVVNGEMSSFQNSLDEFQKAVNQMNCE